tara:strand:- start:511 stop:795 length:285 start_codon:yes stop_codon:yes gene_type:complete
MNKKIKQKEEQELENTPVISTGCCRHCGEPVTANKPNRREVGHPEARSVTHPMTNDQRRLLLAGFEDDYDDNAAWARDMRANQLMEESATGDEV